MDNYSETAAIDSLEKYTKRMTKTFKDRAYKITSASPEDHSQFHFYLNRLLRSVRSLREKDSVINAQFEEFVHDKIIYDPESNDYMKISLIYIDYKEWYKDNHGSIVGLRPLRDLKDFLDKKYSYHYPTGYKGLSFIIEEPLLIDSNLDFVEDE